MPEFPAVAHVAVTVSDLDASRRWYTALLGSEPVLDELEERGGFHHAVYALAGGQLFGLHAHVDHPAASDFDERRTGLDHVAFSCADRAELEQWVSRLDDLGITHGGIVDAAYGSGLSFRDPDGIALELFAPPS